ncbi:MAG: DUF3426 domain-containing protein [Burkholderiaceae bacterium]
MSYTTRCPACGTMFKVVPDQLKISDGWVRCGHCSDVFDATLYLEGWPDGNEPGSAAPAASVEQEQPAPSPPPVPVPVPVPAFPPRAAVVVVPAPETANWPFDDDLPGEALTQFSPMEGGGADEAGQGNASDRVADVFEEALASVDREVVPHAGETPTPPAAESAPTSPASGQSTRGVSEDFHAELLQFASSASASLEAITDPVDIPIGMPMVADGPAEPAEPAAPDAASVPESEAQPESVPDFVRQARRKAFWRKPWVRVTMFVTLILLGSALLGQWAYHDRHRLAAWQPGLRPALQLLCSAPACAIEPLRRIDDVVIDSTALVRRLGDFYAFDIVLKNRSDVDLAVPALELTLTDTREHAIARRVFLPGEWPTQPGVLPAQGSLDVSLQLSIHLADDVPMAGYRALVFYP